jgi:hypothetical protein
MSSRKSLLFPPYFANVKPFAGLSAPLGIIGTMQNCLELRYILSFSYLATSAKIVLATSSSLISS